MKPIGTKNSSGQSPGLENVSGLDPKIFNVIFTLITGSPTLGSGHKKISKMDIWDFAPGLEFFGEVLFKNGLVVNNPTKAHHMKVASK